MKPEPRRIQIWRCWYKLTNLLVLCWFCLGPDLWPWSVWSSQVNLVEASSLHLFFSSSLGLHCSVSARRIPVFFCCCSLSPSQRVFLSVVQTFVCPSPQRFLPPSHFLLISMFVNSSLIMSNNFFPGLDKCSSLLNIYFAVTLLPTQAGNSTISDEGCHEFRRNCGIYALKYLLWSIFCGIFVVAGDRFSENVILNVKLRNKKGKP